MPRHSQPRGTKGSLKWIQDLVNLHPAVLDEAIESDPVEWRSPLADDDYAEYRDQAFLDRLGVTLLARPLQTFWPRSGPRWDALGLVLGQRVVLVEAKAHLPEVESLTRAEGESRSMIQAAFAEVAQKVAGGRRRQLAHHPLSVRQPPSSRLSAQRAQCDSNNPGFRPLHWRRGSGRPGDKGRMAGQVKGHAPCARHSRQSA